MNIKTGIFEISRWTAVVLALVCLLTMFGSNKWSSADPAEVEAAVIAELDMSAMVKADNQMVKRLYGLDPAAFESCILYYPTTNMMAEEVLIVKLSDVSQQETVRAAVEARLQTQKTTFEGYGVEQFDMLTNASVIEVRGNYVLFVVSRTADQVRQAFLDAL